MLESIGISVPSSDRFFKYFIVYDFESILKKVSSEESNASLNWTTEHIPVSCSIASNVPNYESPHCIIHENPKTLVQQMIEYMMKIAVATQEIMQEKFSWVSERLDEMITNAKSITTERTNANSDTDEQSSESTNVSTTLPVPKRTKRAFIRKLKQIQAKFELYCNEIPVLSFNGKKYDINLVKSHLFSVLLSENLKPKFVIKQNNSYQCISTGSLRFLDVTNYLGACSYSSFLKSFNVSEQKSFFPYEWFDDFNKLDFNQLPSYECFYSSLKQQNVLDNPTGSGRRNYEDLQTVWNSQNMQTVGDLLVFYNNRDVSGFVEGVIKMQTLYFNMNVNLFKDAISLPGISIME